MLEIFAPIAMVVAAAGALIAGIWDLKTTDIPDEVTALMIFLGPLIWFLYAAFGGGFVQLAYSLVLGTVVLAIGWGLYLAGKWGGGDAVLLAGIFYLLPDPIFLLGYIFNFFLVSLVYSVTYALVLGLKHPKVFGYATAEIKQKKNWLLLLIWIMVGIPTAAFWVWMGFSLIPITIFWTVIFGSILFLPYTKQVERRIFHRTIPVSKLKPGMVLKNSTKWIGLTEAEVANLRKSKEKTVEVKEGIRFGMVFFLTLIVTILFGNLIFLAVGL